MSYLKPTTSFEVIKPIYQTYDISTENGVEVLLGTKIFDARPTMYSDPIYVVDDKDIVHSKRKSIVLKRVEDINALSNLFNTDSRPFIIKQLKDARIDSVVEDGFKWRRFLEYVYKADYAFNDEKIGDFVDVKTLQPTELWKDTIKNIIQFNCKKDPSIALTDKAILPIGVIMNYVPHKLMITDPHVGKSTFGERVGSLYDKVTRATLLGSVKGSSAEEKMAGIFANQYYPVYLEQIESQMVENLLGFLLTYLESGRARVSGSGVDMEVIGAACMVITANPIDVSSNRLATLGDMVQILCRNSYALGRRFGLICFNKYDPLINYGDDDVKHKELIGLYRAMEERAIHMLRLIWKHPKIMEYCLKPIYDLKGDDKIFMDTVEACDRIEVKGFLRAHLQHASPHTRGGSVNCALVDLLPVIALVDILGIGTINAVVDRIIESAEVYASKLKEVNKNSIMFALSKGA